MTEKESDQLTLLETRVRVLEAENALLNAQHDAYEDFIWSILAMFGEKNMKAFSTWISSVLAAIDALPNGDKIKKAIGANK